MVFSASRAEVAELVDAHASGACGATCVSSNLSFRTNNKSIPFLGCSFFVFVSTSTLYLCNIMFTDHPCVSALAWRILQREHVLSLR